MLEESETDMKPNPPKTKYQKSHWPVSRLEVKCDGKPNADDECDKCGRWPLKVAKKHNPNRTGSLGYIETYGDGSKRFVIED